MIEDTNFKRYFNSSLQLYMKDKESIKFTNIEFTERSFSDVLELLFISQYQTIYPEVRDRKGKGRDIISNDKVKVEFLDLKRIEFHNCIIPDIKRKDLKYFHECIGEFQKQNKNAMRGLYALSFAKCKFGEHAAVTLRTICKNIKLLNSLNLYKAAIDVKQVRNQIFSFLGTSDLRRFQTFGNDKSTWNWRTG